MQEVLQSQSTAARRRIYFTAVKIDDVTDYLTSTEMSGGTWAIKITKLNTATATPSSTTITEVDSTNHIGLWYWEGNATDFDTLGPLIVKVQNTGGTKTMRERDILVLVTATDRLYVTPAASITQVGGTNIATPTTAGVMRVDVKAMEASVLTATAIASDAITAAKIAPAAIDLATIADDALLGAFGVLDYGTAQSGSTGTTIKLRAAASAVDGSYVGATVFTKSGTGALQVNQGTGYVGTTKVLTVGNTWATTPDATTTYVVMAASAPGSAPSSSANAAAVWAAIIEGSHNAGDMIRGMMAAIANKASGYSTGTIVFRSMDDSKTRITVTTSSDGRVNVVYDDLT